MPLLQRLLLIFAATRSAFMVLGIVRLSRDRSGAGLLTSRLVGLVASW